MKFYVSSRVRNCVVVVVGGGGGGVSVDICVVVVGGGGGVSVDICVVVVGGGGGGVSVDICVCVGRGGGLNLQVDGATVTDGHRRWLGLQGCCERASGRLDAVGVGAAVGAGLVDADHVVELGVVVVVVRVAPAVVVVVVVVVVVMVVVVVVFVVHSVVVPRRVIGEAITLVGFVKQLKHHQVVVGKIQAVL
jgi:hypothetical protein